MIKRNARTEYLFIIQRMCGDRTNKIKKFSSNLYIYIYRKKFFQDFFEYIFYTRRTTRDLIVKAGCNVNARFVIP